MDHNQADVILRLAPPPVRRRWDEVAANTPTQVAEAQRMAREWKRLVAPGKSRSECALDECAAPRQSAFARPTEPARAMKLGVALKADIADCAVNVAIGRKARLQESSRQRPECAPKLSFRSDRESGFPALCGSLSSVSWPTGRRGTTAGGRARTTRPVAGPSPH